jgi:hypothetical protein
MAGFSSKRMEAHSDLAVGLASSATTVVIPWLFSPYDRGWCPTVDRFRVQNRTISNESIWRPVAAYKGDAGECPDADCLCRR